MLELRKYTLIERSLVGAVWDENSVWRERIARCRPSLPVERGRQPARLDRSAEFNGCSNWNSVVSACQLYCFLFNAPLSSIVKHRHGLNERPKALEVSEGRCR